tara:strand:+ start:123 stop:383 length:261 start_codon:yes stop_codon:yes gene_type:complete
MYNKYEVSTNNSNQIYYKVWCDEATRGYKTDLTFELYEFNEMIEWLNTLTLNNWEYKVFIEVWHEEGEWAEHIAELQINKQLKESK